MHLTCDCVEQVRWFKPLQAGSKQTPACPVRKKRALLASVPSEWQAMSYFAVGIANSAPFSVLSGQRCMIDFCFV